jgi:crotonobetainyl-CoA:carnitine CoA-transferase CaiB-like acyl-CoA transferase
VVGRSDLIDDPRFRTTADRRDNRSQLEPIVSDILRTRTRAEWQKLLGDADIPQGPILDVGEALHSEQLTARQVLMTMQHPTAGDLQTVRSPIRFVGEDLPDGPAPSPRLGEHTRQVCRELLGWDDRRIDELAQQGTIQTGPHDPDPDQGPS